MIFQPTLLPSIEVFTPEVSPLEVARMVVYNEIGKILIAQRMNGIWHLPGGKTDGETLVVAGIRETLEETGAKAEPISDFVPYTQYVMTNRRGYNIGRGYVGREYRAFAAEAIVLNEAEIRPRDETIAVAFATIEEMHSKYRVGTDTCLALRALQIHGLRHAA